MSGILQRPDNNSAQQSAHRSTYPNHHDSPTLYSRTRMSPRGRRLRQYLELRPHYRSPYRYGWRRNNGWGSSSVMHVVSKPPTRSNRPHLLPVASADMTDTEKSFYSPKQADDFEFLVIEGLYCAQCKSSRRDRKEQQLRHSCPSLRRA